MHTRIQLLPMHLVNQIAAGEVIERPASVLKELLENSIDAGSTYITIALEKGGVQLLCIEDNGKGIYKDDLTLALTQHATSKIASMKDLETVSSLGFRGEALASIGSVCRLRLCSKPIDQEIGWEITTNGRDVHYQLAPVACRQGTRVEVCDLFYNTLPRRKFLSSEKTEFHHLENVFKRIALSHFEIGFAIRYNQQKERRYPPCVIPEMRSRRIRELCGKAFFERALYVESVADNMKLWGWLDTNQVEPYSDVQLFFVNGRFVRDKVMLHAVKQACLEQGILEARGPSYLLYLDIDPEQVDVNIHPTKSEVRFRESRLIHGFLWHSIKKVLGAETNPMVVTTNYNTELVVDNKMDEKTPLTIMETILPSVSPDNFIIIHQKLLLISNEEDIWILDVEKANFYFSKKILTQSIEEEFLESRLLAIPKRIKIHFLIEDLERIKPIFLHFGFDVSQVGLQEILIRSVPKNLQFNSIDSIFKLIPETFFLAKNSMLSKTVFVDFLLKINPFQKIFSIEKAKFILQKIEAEYIENNNFFKKNKIYRKLEFKEFISLLF